MITSKEDAVRAAHWGSYACFAITAFTLLILGLNASLASPTVPWLKNNALVDAFLFLVLGVWLMLRISRTASVIALLLYLTETAWKWDNVGKTAFTATQILWMCLFTVAFIQGIRGTFAFNALKNVEPQDQTSPGTQSTD